MRLIGDILNVSTKLRTIVRIFSKDQIVHIQNHGEYRVKDIPEELLDLTVRCVKNNIDCMEVFTYE